MDVPIFPLSTVLFPGGPLPLRIFEARYLDMVSRCMREDLPFGVVLIREGAETGPAKTYEVGTLARIRDWYQGSDGLLGVTAVGEDRFRLRSTTRQKDGLNIGTISLLPEEERVAMPEEYRGLTEVLATVLDDLGRLYSELERDFDDAGWVTWRFLEVLPIEAARKQACLENGSPEERLRIVLEMLETVRSSG